MSTVTTITIIGAVVALGIGVTWYEVQLTPPPGWLVAWTGWIGGVIGVVAGLRLIWLGVRALQFYVDKRNA